MPIHLYIEELVLRGFDPADRFRIQEAVERELAQLLRQDAERGDSWPAGAAARYDIPTLDAGAVPVRPGTPAAAIGAHAARSVHDALRAGIRAGGGHSPR